MVFLSCKEYMAFKKELLILVTINDSSVTHLAFSCKNAVSKLSHICLTRSIFGKMSHFCLRICDIFIHIYISFSSLYILYKSSYYATCRTFFRAKTAYTVRLYFIHTPPSKPWVGGSNPSWITSIHAGSQFGNLLFLFV